MNITDNEHATHKDKSAILHQALKALQRIVPLEYETKPVQVAHDQGYDFIVTGEIHGQEMFLCVQTHKRLTKTAVFQALIHKDQVPHPLLLVTNYVNSKAAERLHGDIQFIDTVGNAFLDQPSLYIYVKGNKPGKEEIARPIGRIFKGVGLKIPYLLLCRPELTGRPYRELAKMTNVALGTVSSAIAELIQKGYLRDTGKQLLNRRTLFERWIPAYADYLKPKLLLGRFQGEGDWWKKVQLDPAVAQWGGEVAAAKLTKYLKPGTVTLYADKDRLSELVIANRLKKDPNGNVEIVERFWPQKGFEADDAVHPILIYADLLALGEHRTMETARMIYEQHLYRQFGQD